MKLYHNHRLVGQIILGRFCKFGVNESQHLLWKEGGVPCIDADAFDKTKDKFSLIYIRTNKRRFQISTHNFDGHKKEINYGDYGRQYYVDKEFWDIIPLKQTDNSDNKSSVQGSLLENDGQDLGQSKPQEQEELVIPKEWIS